MNLQEIARLLTGKQQQMMQNAPANPDVNRHLAPMASTKIPPRFMQENQNPLMQLAQRVLYGSPERSQQLQEVLGMYQEGQEMSPEQIALLNDESMDAAIRPVMGLVGGRGGKAKALDDEYLALKRMVKDMPIKELARKMVINQKPDKLFDRQVQQGIKKYTDTLDFIPDNIPEEVLERIIASINRYGPN
jgi:hypothetical protein